VKQTQNASLTARLCSLLACLTLLGWNAEFASAQVLYGSIVGTVRDPSGAVVSKASVTATHTSTGLFRQVSADDAGYYSIQNLPQGDYNLAVSATGFRPLTEKGVNVLISTATRIDLNLEVGSRLQLECRQRLQPEPRLRRQQHPARVPNRLLV